ncbi:MAG: cysteine-rich CWC family protein [Pseudohaliea sp.]
MVSRPGRRPVTSPTPPCGSFSPSGLRRRPGRELIAMTAGNNTTCPRCGGRFQCMAGTGLPCPCAEVPLNSAQRAAIAARWEGCLCQRCLRALSDETKHLAEKAP